MWPLRACLPAALQLYPLPRPSIEAEEEALAQRRLALHALLGLPSNRPLLRAANAVDWSPAGGGSGASGGGAAGLAAALSSGGVGGKPRLGDVHVGLPAPPLGGSVHLVQGSYEYYHYMQVGAGPPLGCFVVCAARARSTPSPLPLCLPTAQPLPSACPVPCASPLPHAA